jgi:hypothetical protein
LPASGTGLPSISRVSVLIDQPASAGSAALTVTGTSAASCAL